MKLLMTCEGEPSYKEAVQIVAKRKKTTMMKLVRQALDATYGPEIARELSFFVSGDNSGNQSVTKRSKKDGNNGR
jgi:hypothetical protein